MLREELASRPGRLAAVLRTATCCALVVAVATILEIPLAAYAAYVVLLIAREDVVATAVMGLVAAVAVTLAVALTLLLFALDAGEPGLRLPLMAMATVAGMYASRALKVGPAAFLGTFIIVLSQTLIDRFTTTEVLVRLVLWLWIVVMLPVAVVVVSQLLTGERPAARARRSALHLLRALADVLRNPGAGSLRERHAEAFALVESTRRAAMIDAAAKRRLGGDARLIELLATLLAMQEVLPAETPFALRRRLADACDACATAFERGDAAPPPAEPAAMAAEIDQAPLAAQPVALAMAEALERLRDGLDRRIRGVIEPGGDAHRPPVSSVADRADNLHFALKSALAVMAAYAIYTGLAWPQISTAVTTCFFVALGSMGETLHKLTLRVAGALVGGFAAGFCIAVLIPSMTDIGHLCLLIGAAAAVCAWVATSSERLSYMGLQMAFAFFLGILQGERPPTEFQVLRDRVIGILLGNVLVTVIFSILWPASAKGRSETAVRQTLDELATFVVGGMPREAGHRLALLESTGRARRFAAFASFERAIPDAPGASLPRPISVPELERLVSFAFVAAEARASEATAQSLRRGHEKAAALLRALARTTPSGDAETDPGIRSARSAGTADLVGGMRLPDRAALEANMLFLVELEKAHGVAT